MTDHLQPTVEERIAQIQLNAYANLGYSPMEISAYFKSVRERIESFADKRPNYLSQNFSTPSGDNPIERDLKARFHSIPTMPFQEPFIHSWLTDVWHYHRVRVYKNEAPAVSNLVLGTAPTGGFNALAIHDQSKNGILIEDGLLYFCRQFCSLISRLLYRQNKGRMEFVNVGDELDAQISANHSIIESLIDTTVDYLVDGFLVPPNPHPLDQDDKDSEVVGGDLMFNGLMTFVIEHELHHLLARPEGKHLLSNVKESFEDLWKIFEKDVIPQVSSTVEKEEVRQIFEDHQEEIYGDYRAVKMVLAQARIDRSIWPTLDGPMVFFHVTELFRWVLLVTTDPERLKLEAQLDGVWLSIAAILHDESHPYPLVRRAGVLEFFKRVDEPFYGILLERDERFIQVFNTIRQSLLRRVKDGAMPKQVSAKWRGSQKALVST